MSTEAITQAIISDATATPDAPAEDALSIDGEIAQAQKTDPDLASRLSILAKKEKSIIQRHQEIQRKLKEIEEKEKRFGGFEELDKLATDNPAEFFKKKGLSFEQIQQKMLESLSDEDLDPVQKQIKELQQKLASKDDEVKKLLEETLSARDKKAQEVDLEEKSKYYHEELKKHIDTKAEDYDLIKTFGAEDEVFNVIKSVYLQTAEKGSPKLMTFDEACTLYEKKLEELVHGMQKSKKVSKIFGVSDPEDPFAQVFGQTTLDDSYSQSSATSNELKTEEERLRAAAKLFEQQMKSL